MTTAVMEPTASDGECLMFWYYMEGSGVGDLRVYLQSPDNSSQSVLLWTRSGDQGKHWRHGRVTISSRTPYQVPVGRLSNPNNHDNDQSAKQKPNYFWSVKPDNTSIYIKIPHSTSVGHLVCSSSSAPVPEAREPEGLAQDLQCSLDWTLLDNIYI